MTNTQLKKKIEKILNSSKMCSDPTCTICLTLSEKIGKKEFKRIVSELLELVRGEKREMKQNKKKRKGKGGWVYSPHCMRCGSSMISSTGSFCSTCAVDTAAYYNRSGLP